MIDVSGLIDDPEFAQAFTIKRPTGTFANDGEYSTSSTTLTRTGIIQPASADDLAKFLPEGERQERAIKVWCRDSINMTDGRGQNSDIVVYRGENYRVAYAKPWNDHGFVFVVATWFAQAGSSPTRAPLPVSYEVMPSGTSIVVTFDGDLDDSASDDGILLDGGTTVSAVASGTTLTITVGKVYVGDNVAVSYDAWAGSLSGGGFPVASFGPVGADNNSTQVRPTPVSKVALQVALASAAQLVQGDYTSESWAVLAAAVSAGQSVYDNAAATQVAVNNAAAAINNAIAALQPAGPTSYPLGDDGTLAATFGFGALTMTAPDYNEGEHIYSGTTTGGTALGLPAAANYLTSQAFVVGAGTVLHIEFEPIVPSCYQAGVQGFPLLGLGLIMSTGGVFGGVFGTVGIHDDNGSTPIYRGSLITDTVRATADGPVRMSVDLDGSDGSVKVRTADGNTIVSATTFTPGTAFTPYLFVSDGPAPLSGNVVISLVPKAVDATLPHNPGAVDLLGEAVP